MNRMPRVAFVSTSVRLKHMRFAVISDIHANLEALQKAFEIIDTKNIDAVYCLGDIVGYGANPNECISLLQKRGVSCIEGNHDQAVIDMTRTADLNRFARAALEWTSSQLTPEHLHFLSNLPFEMHAHGCLFVHSSPDDPEEWNYIVTDYDAQEYFSFFTEPICWVGHSHVSGVYCEDNVAEEVEKGKRYIINVGSVGQPRNHDPRLSFGIFDVEAWEYEHITAEYDVDLARKKIIDAGLPAYLGDRLLAGI